MKLILIVWLLVIGRAVYPTSQVPFRGVSGTISDLNNEYQKRIMKTGNSFQESQMLSQLSYIPICEVRCHTRISFAVSHKNVWKAHWLE